MRLTAFILILLTLNAGAASAQWGTISGTITAASDGSPLVGAKVVPFVSGGAEATDPAGGHVGTTDASGAYSFPVFSSGPFYLRIQALGFVTQLYNGIACDHHSNVIGVLASGDADHSRRLPCQRDNSATA